jgi:hypothetical protein
MSYKVALVSSALALPAVTFTILISICLSPAFFTWRLSVARKTTLVLRVPVITCFNNSKVEHKSYACPKPQKPNIIHEIKEKDTNTDVTNVTDKDLGKEQA